MKPTLGIDIGGVIIDRIHNQTNEDTFFTDEYLTTPITKYCFGAISILNEMFEGRVYLISKAGKKTEERSLNWLNHKRFGLMTGVPIANVYFCRSRSDKVPIAEKLGITHYIDDRMEILNYMFDAGITNLYLLNGDYDEISEYSQRNYHANQVIHKPIDWIDLLSIVINNMEPW